MDVVASPGKIGAKTARFLSSLSISPSSSLLSLSLGDVGETREARKEERACVYAQKRIIEMKQRHYLMSVWCCEHCRPRTALL
jgi:hypothetical protein